MASSPAKTALELHNQKLVAEGRKKFFAATSEHLLDYKHNNPHHIVNAGTMLIKIFGNVLDNPSEEKFRKVKAASNAFKNNIAFIRGGEELMLLAGWMPKVVEMEKYWVFEHPVGDVKFGILAECLDVLRKGLATMEEKARRVDSERAAKMGKGKEERERILLAIQDDALERKMRAEIAHITTPSVKATPLPSELPRQGHAAMHAGGGPRAHAAHGGGMLGGQQGPSAGMGGLGGMGGVDDDDDEDDEDGIGGGQRGRHGGGGGRGFAGKGQKLSESSPVDGGLGGEGKKEQ